MASPTNRTGSGGVSRRGILGGVLGTAALPLAANLFTGPAAAASAPPLGARAMDGTSTTTRASAATALELLPDVPAQHPRFILGTRVDLQTLRDRATRPAYEPFVTAMLEYCDNRPDLPTIGNPGHDGEWQTIYWALPELVTAWLITGDETYRTKIRAWVLKVVDPVAHPEWGPEEGGSMSNAVGLIGISIAYDWAYELFDDDERAQIRDRLINQSLKLEEQFSTNVTGELAYWKHDWQNNHMHKRVDGLLAAVAVTYGERGQEHLLEDAARLHRCSTMARSMLAWIAQDGSNHEGPTYAQYGFEHVVRVVDALAGLTGEQLWHEPVLGGMGDFKIHVQLPQFAGQNAFGDADGGQYYFNPYLWRIASQFDHGHLQEFCSLLYDAAPGSFFYHTWNMLWHDDTVQREPLSGYPRTGFFDDLGYVATRTGWGDDAVSLHVKSGPAGGRRLNEWRDRIEPDRTYVNVAHDHPDAGHWSVSADGVVWGQYAPYGEYLTRYRNTITVGDDTGQAGETSGWFQPYPDMRDRAHITQVLTLGPITVIGADISGAYTSPSSAGLTHAERWFALIGGMVVVLDDVRSAEPQDIHTLFHALGDVEQAGTGWRISQERTGADPAVAALVTQAIGGSSTSGESFLPQLGTLFRATAPDATEAAFVTVLMPRSSSPAAEVRSGAGTVRVGASLGGGVREHVALSRGGSPGALTAAGAAAVGRLLRVHEVQNVVDAALLVDGTRLGLGDLAVDASKACSLSLERVSGGLDLLVSDGPGVRLQISGVEAPQRARLSLDGAEGHVARAGDTLTIDVPERGDGHQIELRW